MTTHTTSAKRMPYRIADRDIANHAGLFLVRPEHMAGLRKATARSSQSRALYGLGAAAVAAPLLWFTHTLLHLLRIH
jgi:hypothetical protein